MIKRLKGTEDILPDNIWAWRHIEEASRRVFELYCYREVRTPIIEEKSLFARSVGEDTDIVKKQMYAFKDQGGRDIALRPEETASVVRAYLENNIDKKEGFVKLFYAGPMFRSERPQAGRLRQFHQIGVEAIGSYSPFIDAEVIILLNNLLRSYGLDGYKIKINSLGCDKDKSGMRQLLRKELKYELNLLCEDCNRRYESNILRVLDCKNPACKKIVGKMSLSSALCGDCEKDFSGLQSLLKAADLRYEVSPLLVRGLDYYTKTVFEVTADRLGAQDAVAAGGRYDNLVSDFGGEHTGACGFAIGVERVIEIIKKARTDECGSKNSATVFIAALGDEAKQRGFMLLNELRSSGFAADTDYLGRSLKSQMRYADKIKARHVVILGEDELKREQALIKDMIDGSQRTVGLNKLTQELKKC